MKFASQRKKTGFTLIEVMVVLTIIGILLAVALTTLFQARKESRDRMRVAELEQLKLSLKLFKEASGDYPGGSYGGDDGVQVTDGNFVSDLADYTAVAYEDPLNSDPYRYWYDSDYDCNGDSYTVVAAETVEVAKNSNISSACGGVSTQSHDGWATGDSFIVLVRKNPIP